MFLHCSRIVGPCNTVLTLDTGHTTVAHCLAVRHMNTGKATVLPKNDADA